MMSFLKILFVLLPLFSLGQEWQRISTDQQISFLFPNSSQKLNKVINGIPATIYQTKDITCVFGVVCSDLSGKKIKMTPETATLFYEELKTGSLKVENTILKNEQTIPFENMIIKEIEYSIVKDKFEMTYFKRFIFRENHIYQISIGGRSRHMDVLRKSREVFFNSVHFEKLLEKP